MSQPRRLIGLGLMVAAVAVVGFSGYQDHNEQIKQQQTYQPPVNQNIDVGKISDKSPNEVLANSVMTEGVKDQLRNKIEFNGHGAFIVADNKTDLDANVTSAPYVDLAEVDSKNRAGQANALLSKSSRQYKDRRATGNSNTIEPSGWNQKKIAKGRVLYNRGHSIGYALAGSIKGFNASEANVRNITTQTAWANQASNNDEQNTGQNYYEGLVRKALDTKTGIRIRYRVTPIYDGDNLVPSGNHIEAKSNDGSLEFNVFVPNVQPGVQINYSDGSSQIKQ